MGERCDREERVTATDCAAEAERHANYWQTADPYLIILLGLTILLFAVGLPLLAGRDRDGWKNDR